MGVGGMKGSSRLQLHNECRRSESGTAERKPIDLQH